MDFFNLKKGMKFEDVRSVSASINPQPDLRGEWFSFTPFDDHSPYVHFSCRILHKKGLSQICAWTKNITTKSNGAELNALFAGLRSRLEEDFGSCKILDGFTTPIPFYKDDSLYMNALTKGERILAAEFHRDYGSRLNDELQMVQLQAFGRTDDSGNVMLKLFF